METNQPEQLPAEHAQPRRRTSKPSKPSVWATKKLWIIGIGLAVLLATSVVTWRLLSAPEGPRKDRYQAVFLDNGQAFFGKLKNIHGEYLVVENAYRAQSQNLPSDATEQQKQAVANNVSLVKVGKEVYGPESIVRIRAEQVVFWQNLEPDSKVTKAIRSDDSDAE